MNDYLSYLSYQSYIYPAYARIMHQNLLEVPKLSASVELTKMAVTCTPEEMAHKVQEIKNHPDLYNTDIHGVQFLVHKLNELQFNEKASLIMQAFQERSIQEHLADPIINSTAVLIAIIPEYDSEPDLSVMTRCFLFLALMYNRHFSNSSSR